MSWTPQFEDRGLNKLQISTTVPLIICEETEKEMTLAGLESHIFCYLTRRPRSDILSLYECMITHANNLGTCLSMICKKRLSFFFVVNALTIPSVVHILRLDRTSELIKQTMIQVIKEVKIKQNEMIRCLKKNPILATADWLLVQKSN